jgi:hypothetical protein
MDASLLRTSRVRRGLVLLAIGCALGTLTTLACSSDDGQAADESVPTGSIYVPAEAAAQNPIPPGVAPRTPDPDPSSQPMDSGSKTDSGSTPPKTDAGAPDAMM